MCHKRKQHFIKQNELSKSLVAITHEQQWSQGLSLEGTCNVQLNARYCVLPFLEDYTEMVCAVWCVQSTPAYQSPRFLGCWLRRNRRVNQWNRVYLQTKVDSLLLFIPNMYASRKSEDMQSSLQNYRKNLVWRWGEFICVGIIIGDYMERISHWLPLLYRDSPLLHASFKEFCEA